jgi:hypothetical protein
VLAMVHFVDEEWSSKILLLEMTKPMSDFVDSSLLFVANSLSHFSAQLIAFQAALMSSHVYSYSHTSSKVRISSTE